MKFVQTVNGNIAPEDMGFTLPHEHIFWDLSYYLPEDVKNAPPSDYRKQPINTENRDDLQYHLWEYSDNVVQQDEAVALRELLWYKKAGGGTICDNSSYGLKGNPAALRRVSQKSGVNILLGTGAYFEKTLPDFIKPMDKYALAELMVQDIKDGICGTDIKCGFIGEIGLESQLPEASYRALAAAAIAQKKTGAAILIHQPGTERVAEKIFKILTDHGGDLNRTVMCHCDPHIPDHDYIDFIGKSGAYISFDFFGLEAMLSETFWLPSDRDRIFAILDQISRGNLNRLLVSHDVAYKYMLRQYGGHGYSHILKNMIPVMLANGFKKEWVDSITKTNPQRLFALDTEILK